MKRKKNPESKKLRVEKTNKGKLMFLLKCAVCDNKKSRFMKNQKASGLLNNLGLKKQFSKILVLGEILS